MTARDSFMLLRSLKTIDNEYTIIEKAREQLMITYGSRTENNDYQIDKNNIEAFQKEINALLETKISIECEPISIELFDSIKISPNQMSLIEAFIK